MTPIAIDPSFTKVGSEWTIPKVADTTEPTSGSGGFAGMLGQQIQQLANTQADAATQSQALATGTAKDPAEVVMSVERAQLAMQMATTLRNKGVEAIQEIMRTQV
jgi:flagellar hook-basal body complex protein FliE